MVMSCHQNAEKNRNLLVANKCFKNVAKYKCLEITITIDIAFTKKLKAD